ncbi:MAG: hypothetical protein LWW94_03270 [Candidatus Desulfofervidaceae bacterium]|nr:hypothetical protein [Candidatus Desulfofervidaceae bacterium]
MVKYMIALPAKQKHPASKLDERFGRANYYYLTDGIKGDFFTNPYLNEPSSVGIRVAQWLSNKGVKTIIIRHIGINVLSALSTSGIQVFKAKQEDIKTVLAAFRKGEYQHPLPIPGRINATTYLNGCLSGKRKYVCLNCGYVLSVQHGLPCREIRCPKCGGHVKRLLLK